MEKGKKGNFKKLCKTKKRTQINNQAKIRYFAKY